MSTAIEITDLDCRYGVRRVLDRLDLSLESGASLALLGPNGTGKTTLLRVIAGLLSPRSGKVEVLGERLPGAGACRARIGLVMHEGGFYADLTARENLEFFASLSSLAKATRSSRIQQRLESVGLGDAMDRRAGDFSRGMKQRLAIARALLAEPDLLLLDEPFTGLDRGGRRQIVNLLQNERKRGTSLFMVVHDVEQAIELADESALLVGGHIAWRSRTDCAEEIARAYDHHTGVA